MNPPDPYLAEKVRSAIAAEAHELAIEVHLGSEEAALEGTVETEDQRALVEAIARRLLTVPVQNRLTVVPPDRPVCAEELR